MLFPLWVDLRLSICISDRLLCAYAEKTQAASGIDASFSWPMDDQHAQ
jgi:hypothetical protein